MFGNRGNFRYFCLIIALHPPITLPGTPLHFTAKSNTTAPTPTFPLRLHDTTVNQNNNRFRHVLPHLAAIILFLLVSYAYFYPLLDGKIVQQHDRDMWHGTAKELLDHKEKTGEELLWTTHLFGGMPTALIHLDFPKNIANLIDELLCIGERPASYIFVVMLGFYLLMLACKVKPTLAAAAAIAYAFSTYYFIIIGAGHNAKLHALAYSAPMVAGIIWAYRGKMLGGAALFGLALALSIEAGHIQMTYYNFFIIGALWIAFMILYVKQKKAKRFAIITAAIAAALIIGVGANFNRLYQTWDYGRFSIRGPSELTATNDADATKGLDRSYATGWSYGIAESLNLFIPNLMGGSSSMALQNDSHVATFFERAGIRGPQKEQMLQKLPLYWGDQPMTAGPVYLGAAVIFLFVLALCILKGPIKWGLIASATLTLMLAWGSNFNALTNFFLDYFPFYSKFRTVSSILVVIELIVPLMAFVGLAQWIQKQNQPDARTALNFKNPVILAATICAALALCVAIIGPAIASFSASTDQFYLQNGYPEQFIEALRNDRKDLLRADAFRSLIFVLVAAAALLTYQKYIHRNPHATAKATALLAAAIGLICLADLAPVNKRYDGIHWVSKQHNQAPFSHTPANRYILQDTSYYRVANLAVSTFNDAATSYFHRSVGGYHGAKMGIFQETLEAHSSKPFFWNMLDTKYFIIRDEQGQLRVQQNPNAYGPAWLVDSIHWVPDANQELYQLQHVDLKKTAVIRSTPTNHSILDKIKPTYSSPLTVSDSITAHAQRTANSDAIQFIKKEGNSYFYQTSLSQERLAVLSEIYYPHGWTATLDDGSTLPVLRADYLLRAIPIPAGKHALTLSFDLPVYRWGQWVDLACGSTLLAILIALAASQIYSLLKKTNTATAKPTHEQE